MIDGKFDVVFRGQTTKNFDVDQVKQNLVKLFKSTPEGIDKLFTGSEVVIRKDLDYTQAMKYQSALKNAGALALIKEVESPQQEPVKQQVSQPAKFQSKEETEAEKANDSSLNQESKSEKPSSAASESPDIQDQANQAGESEPADEEGFGLAKAGEKILPDKVYEKREVDTEHLSVGEVGDRLLPDKPPEEHPQPSIDHLSLEDPK